ncbi:MAG: HEAT repeat domain-containing protein [Planctomycetota bacterium]
MKQPVATVESDLTTIRHKLEKVLKEAEQMHSQLASQLHALQAEKESLLSRLEQARSEANEARVRENAVRKRVTAAESELAAARLEMERADRPVKHVNPSPASDVSAARTKKKTVLSEGGRKKAAAVPAQEKVEPLTEAIVAKGDRQGNVKIEQQQSQPLINEKKASNPTDVTTEQVQTAIFPNTTDRIIFTKALSDITSQDKATRIDAARAMAGVRHNLSVRALTAQIEREPSAQVRQQCIKALTSLEMKEGLNAVKHSLADTAASVRLAAVWALYCLAGEDSATALTGIFSDEDEEVRRRAVTCIGWLGQKQPTVKKMNYLRSRQVVSALIERLNDPAESIRHAALDALEATTGRKFGELSPANRNSHQCLIEQWRKWWKEELLG